MAEAKMNHEFVNIISELAAHIRLSALMLAGDDKFATEGLEQELLGLVAGFITMDAHVRPILDVRELTREAAQLWIDSLTDRTT